MAKSPKLPRNPVKKSKKNGDLRPLEELISEANRLAEFGATDQAIDLYKGWLSHSNSPVAYAAHFNLGILLSNQQDRTGAEHAYRAAITLHPSFSQAHLNLGTQLELQGRYDEALAQWGCVLDRVAPDSAENRGFLVLALNNLGRLLEIRKRYSEAESMLKRSLTLSPDQSDVLYHLVHLRQKQCEWPVYQSFNGITVDDMLSATSPLAMLSETNDPELQLKASRRFVEKKVLTGVSPLSDESGYTHDKLRIGYLSSDFCSHAVSILTVELFELHNRSTVDVYGFSWSREDGTPLRARVVKALNNYVPIDTMSDEEAAKCIRSHEIDVLIDLQGLTLGTRPDILSYRPAPVQVTYLGYVGPTALPSIDYVIADRFVLPEELRPFFTEKPLYMPHSYQVNDRKREIGPKPTRAQCNLPEDAFVFCAFNNNYKFSPAVFGAWMRILVRIPDSVLWVVTDSPEVRSNLQATAEKQGVSPLRLVFAERVAPPEYLARYQVADLFLDTMPFNAGTTASDALWAGLPVLTYSGRTFASRMAGSLLLAVDLPELITYSLSDYEEKAVELASHRGRVEAMKQQLITNRLTCPLFDTPQFVEDFEALLLTVAKGSKVPSTEKQSIHSGNTQSSPMQLPAYVPMDAAQQTRVLNFMVKTVWGLTDSARFYEIMDEAIKLLVPGYYLGDNLLTWGRNNSLFDDPAFLSAWNSNVQNDADRAIAWRRYILACAAYHCAQLPGDFVECGVYRGTGIKTVIDYFGNKGFTKQFWGYDTFDYNPIEGHAFVGQQDGLFEEIKKRFDGYDQVHLVRGLLPESLIDNSPQRICYLHIDLNSAKYEIAVLEQLFDRVVPGGVIILDDYEWAGIYREQKITEDAWFARLNYRVFPLPTGQGLVLKR